MDRLISLDELLRFPIRADHCDKEHANEDFINGIETVFEYVETLPTVDAEPVRHGKWKQWDSYGFEETYECTACGEAFVLIEGTPITNGYKYCPNCGARMDGEE